MCWRERIVMATGELRHYFNSSIAQLEDLFERSQDDSQVLKALERELNEHRNTDKATRLLERVRRSLSNLGPPDNDLANHVEPKSAAETTASPSAAPTARQDRTVNSSQDNALPLQLDLGALPIFSPAEADNEPRAILAAWTALESLSPQTYRRPEDLAAGDRRSVASLGEATFPGVKASDPRRTTNSIIRLYSAQSQWIGRRRSLSRRSDGRRS